ncbi:hypothetical protein [Ralstonia solanacearum]|uniref:hypothetical protein n=1 Tax=Ralstonia solanacearum TaxID=305 RepID=UPI003CC5AD4C
MERIERSRLHLGFGKRIVDDLYIHRSGIAFLEEAIRSTVNALYSLASTILDPVIDYFGGIRLTYGFCSHALGKRIKTRIAPQLDQHAAYERTSAGKRICTRGGAACDFIVPDEDMEEVAYWIMSNLPFDRLYFYGKGRPIHISYAEKPLGAAYEMRETNSGRRVPRPMILRPTHHEVS